MGCNLYHQKCIDSVNKIIKRDNDLDLAIKAYSVLSEENLLTVNKTLLKYEKIINEDNNIIIKNFDCVNCKNTNTCVFLYCGHTICKNCFIIGDKCGLCGQCK